MSDNIYFADDAEPWLDVAQMLREVNFTEDQIEVLIKLFRAVLK